MISSAPGVRSASNIQSSWIGSGQRRLNGPQTTGGEYRNLSQPTCTMARDDDVEVPVRDGALPLKYLSIGNGPGFQQQKCGAD